jgi:hypothetical protein
VSAQSVSPRVSLRAGRSSAAIGTLAVTLLVVFAAGIRMIAFSSSGAYTVDIRVANPHLQQAQVESLVLQRLGQIAKTTDTGTASTIRGMVALKASDLGSVEPDAGAAPAGSSAGDSVLWVVRATGTFVGDRVPPGAKPIVESTGYFVVDDSTGEIVGMGMP